MIKPVYQYTYEGKNYDLSESHKGKPRIIFHEGVFDPSEIVACALIRHIIPEYLDCPIIRTSSQDIIEEAKADHTAMLINIGDEICPLRKMYDCRTSEEMPIPNIASVIWAELSHAVLPSRQKFISDFVKKIDSNVYEPYMKNPRTIATMLYMCNDFTLKNYILFDNRFDFLVSTVEHALSGIIPGETAEEELERRLTHHPVIHIFNNYYKADLKFSEDMIMTAAKSSGELVVLDDFEHALSKQIYLLPPEKLSCIYPTLSGVWEIRQVPVTFNTDVVKKYFPSEWAGLTGEELSDAVGIPDCLYCSADRKTIQVKYKETAEQVALLGNLIASEQTS